MMLNTKANIPEKGASSVLGTLHSQDIKINTLSEPLDTLLLKSLVVRTYISNFDSIADLIFDNCITISQYHSLQPSFLVGASV